MFKKEIKIGKYTISEKTPAFIIGELSCNHNQNFDVAVESIKKMKEIGVNCVKLQTSKPESLTLKSDRDDFVVKGGTQWDGQKLYDLYTQTHTPWEWHKPLMELANSLGMEFFSSPFDQEAVDFLDNLGVPAFKIASFEITDVPLIEYVASKNKPVIVSTGIATLEDIITVCEIFKKAGNSNLIFLKCTSAYPAPYEEINLKTIPDLSLKTGCMIGLSDHTIGSVVPVGAVVLGARVIEKHFILDRTLGGPDAGFSMEPNEFLEMIDSVRNLEKAIGSVTYELSEKIKSSRNFSRSIYVVRDINKGDVLSRDNIKSIRPGFGLHPKYYKEIIGKKVLVDFKAGDPLTKEGIDGL